MSACVYSCLKDLVNMYSLRTRGKTPGSKLIQINTTGLAQKPPCSCQALAADNALLQH